LDPGLFRASPAEVGAVAIADLHRLQLGRQGVDIVGRIGPRARKRAHVDQHLDPGVAQHVEEFARRTRRMADGGEACRHQSSRVRASSRWAATWSVLSLPLSYCGASFDARRGWPL